ncbi:hypothetical protein ACG74X_00735 [Marivita sp. S0852]|uniref:hypothetical protein n=1 Tax=Marivita sp. S0852 TaxID=3373893 RepID=UPI0039828DF3
MAKADKIKSLDPAQEALNAAQVVFSLDPAYVPQAKHLLQAHEQMLEEAETFWTAWFKRRHEAAQSALDVVAQISKEGTKDPAAGLKAMTEWQTHSLERLTEDVKDCTEMMARCFSSLANHEAQAAAETAETAERATSGKHATPV